MRTSWRVIAFCFLSVLFSLSLPGVCRPTETADHSLYGDLLEKYVKQGIVDYQGFKNEESKLDAYLKVLEETDTHKLSRDEQLAFYINAYNAWTIKLILSAYPDIKSIWDLGSRILWWKNPFKKKIVRIEGKAISLDDLEHGMIRPRFKEPRVHFAVNCASKSCPPLISEPYQGSIVNRQLDTSARAFLNNPERNRLEGNTLYVSKIFKWFKDDFNDDVLGFFLRFAQESLKENLTANREKIEVKYLDYDWSLNGK